jgi:hypothetical protein
MSTLQAKGRRSDTINRAKRRRRLPQSVSQSKHEAKQPRGTLAIGKKNVFYVIESWTGMASDTLNRVVSCAYLNRLRGNVIVNA